MRENKNIQKVSIIATAFSLVVASILIVSCNGNSHTTTSTADSTIVTETAKEASGNIKPKGAAPAWAPDIKPGMLAVIEKLTSYGDRPIESLTAEDARKNHSPADAVADLLRENEIMLPASTVDTVGQDIAVPGGNIHLRIYTPKGHTGSLPVIVYYHGGGFVIAGIDAYNASVRGMAEQTGAIVVAVAFRLGPEYKFPVAHNDAFAAYQWVVNNVASINGDAKKITVMGESAGGNLAANVSIMARDNGVALPVCEVLVYPITGANVNTQSYQKNASAKPLNKPMMEWFFKNYLNNMDEAKDPRINLVAADLKGLEPAMIITDELDPLQSEGMMLADKMKAAGVSVDSKNYDGVTHEFFGMAAIVPQAKDAQAYAADFFKKAFGK